MKMTDVLFKPVTQTITTITITLHFHDYVIKRSILPSENLEPHNFYKLDYQNTNDSNANDSNTNDSNTNDLQKKIPIQFISHHYGLISRDIHKTHVRNHKCIDACMINSLKLQGTITC
jgi:hypothetical protein